MSELDIAEIVNNIVGEEEGTPPAAVKIDASEVPSNGNLNPESKAEAEATIATPEQQPEGEVKPGEQPAEDPNKGQESVVDQAVKSLGKVLGKELTDEDAVEELAKSHLGAEGKIQSLQTQIKEFVPYRQFYDRLASHPRVAEIQAILEGKAPVAPIPGDDGTGYEEEISPKVANELSSMRAELANLKAEREQQSSTISQAKVAESRDKIVEFSKLSGNDRFKQALNDYWQEAKFNQYAKMPEVLQKFAALIDNGIPMDMAWAALNPDLLLNRTKENIAKAQAKGIKPLAIHSNKPATDRKLEDMDDMGELVNAIAERVKAKI